MDSITWAVGGSTTAAYLPESAASARFGTKFVGNSSVEYEVGMYNTSGELLADGKFVHVYVSTDGRPHRIPDMSRKLLDSISVLPDETL